MLAYPHHPPAPTTRPRPPLTSTRQPALAPPPPSQQPPLHKESRRERTHHPASPKAPPPPPADTKPVKPKGDKAKLTELWGLPPAVIKRAEGGPLRTGELLGEGGFARVYLATQDDGVKKAVKVIAKEQLKSTKDKTKLFGEIKIHQAMQHPNIIRFEQCFEDEANVYMQLELCAQGSMLDLLRRRKRYTEPEARFYLVQLIGACEYMHSNSVIHRDLKLGNLMLDAQMNLRVGDFGLAALVKFPGERKKTICGTPNYIAPEILFDTTNGHSFEVDVWSIGVILYTLLVGKPPFQTKDVKAIYRKIKDNSYEWPAGNELSEEAKDLVEAILTTQPENRPTLSAILKHEWFMTGPFPACLSPSIVSAVPEFCAISIRASHRNFANVKKECGIDESSEDEVAVAAVVAPLKNVNRMRKALPALVEEEGEEEVEIKTGQTGARLRTTVATLPATSKEASGMEKEVRQVLQPGSPISELLRSARKPLMVSPNAEPRELLQRKLVAEARAGSASSTASHPLRTTSSSSTAPPRNSSLAASGLTRKESSAGPSTKENDGAPPPARRSGKQAKDAGSTVVAPPRRLGNAAVEKDAIKVTEVKVAVEPISTRFPARELYDLTWRALDCALTISTTAALEALPRPAPDAPKVFISSWVDYTQKYGTAYALTDGSAGLYFNDSTTMVLSPDKIHLDYISNRKANIYSRRHYNVEEFPKDLDRKIYLLRYFEDYMAKTLMREVEWTFSDERRIKNMDFLVKYYRMKNAIVFKLSNDVLQFNFYDHTKILLTQNGSVITFIDTEFDLHTYSLGGLFRDARQLGHYQTHANAQPVDERRAKRLEEIRFVIAKLEYCRDVLKHLSTRKLADSVPMEV